MTSDINNEVTSDNDVTSDNTTEKEPVFLIELDEPVPAVQDVHQSELHISETTEAVLVLLNEVTQNVPFDHNVNDNERESICSSDSGDVYELEDETYLPEPEEEELPTLPSVNYSDLDLAEDIIGDWFSSDGHGPVCAPFSEQCMTNVDLTNNTPETFFNALFDHQMWAKIADETNTYVAQKLKKQRGGRGIIEDLTHPQHKHYRRLSSWKHVTSSDIQLVFAHLIVMGLIKVPKLENYWTTNEVTHIPFFGKYMSRNQFQNIFWNLHICNNDNYLPYGHANHDPLFKLRDFISMCETNFKFAYKPERELSVDEATCAFKGRLRFKCYNKSKPNKFHIKLFQVSEARSGYILGFDIYTGKGPNTKFDSCNTIDSDCTKTTKTVFGMLEYLRLLDVGHHVYMDNFYTSPELFEELHWRNTYACGTVRPNRRGLPTAVTKASLKNKGDTVFRRNSTLLCLRWFDKRPVTLLSSIHEAVDVITHKKDNHDGTRIVKPKCVHEYTNFMSGVDLADQYMANYSFLRKNNKWWKKLVVYLFNAILLNAYILNKKYGSQKMSHHNFHQYIAEYLVKQAVGDEQSMQLKACCASTTPETRLSCKHFPSSLPRKEGSKRTKPSRACVACNFTKEQLARDGQPHITIPKKFTSFWCNKCGKALCIEPCFHVYHTQFNYKHELLMHRLSDKANPLLNRE